jgi:hypothetical protein
LEVDQQYPFPIGKNYTYSDVVGEFMKPVFLHQGCLKKSTVLDHAEQFANNIYSEDTPV